MFEDTVDEIFLRAGAFKALHADLWQECVEILNAQMARLSANQAMGFCTADERVAIWAEQKRVLEEEVRDAASGLTRMG